MCSKRERLKNLRKEVLNALDVLSEVPNTLLVEEMTLKSLDPKASSKFDVKTASASSTSNADSKPKENVHLINKQKLDLNLATATKSMEEEKDDSE